MNIIYFSVGTACIGLVLKMVYYYKDKDLNTFLFDTTSKMVRLKNLYYKIADKIRKNKYIAKFNFFKKNNIFYYLNNKCIYKTNLDVFTCEGIDHDYVLIKGYNNNEEMIRLYDSEKEIAEELEKDNKIKFERCECSILNAKLIIKENIISNVTPLKNGYYCGNKIYSKKYLEFFFNINTDEDYTIKFIDVKIKPAQLNKNQYLELEKDDYKIIDLDEKNDTNIAKDKNSEEEEWDKTETADEIKQPTKKKANGWLWN